MSVMITGPSLDITVDVLKRTGNLLTHGGVVWPFILRSSHGSMLKRKNPMNRKQTKKTESEEWVCVKCV